MNIQFSKGCACIVLLAISFPTCRAHLGNESVRTESTNVVRATDANESWVSRGREDAARVARRDGWTYFTNGDGKEREDCSERSIDDFPADLFTGEQRRHGAILLHAFLGFYCFLLTAFVCHGYLLPSIDRICVNFNISTDVAGATFLAMASSFPEMFVNVIGTFLTESDLGVGTVVGSAVFDTFATPACGALMAFHAISLEWRILSRDCLMFVISVGALVIIMWDQRIRWYEATVLLLLFCFYLILLFCGKGFAQCCGKLVRFDSDVAVKLSNNRERNTFPEGTYKTQHQNDVFTVDDHNRHRRATTADPEIAANSERSEPVSMFDYLFTWPGEQSSIAKCWFSLCWPVRFLLFITIPDARLDRWKQWYPTTFLMCVVWIAISSYLVSWMTTVIGDTVGIPDSIMGLTFLAAGGNMPEIASIVILARQGDGNMAMSNTLGANILDILLCLGLPWTIKCLTTGRDVLIESGALSYSVLSIVVCIVVLYSVIAFSKFQLNKKVGFICLLLYTIFLVFAVLVETNVFFSANLPMCD